MAHLPSLLSDNCVDIIAQLCCDEGDRIGSKNGAVDIKAHPWFKVNHLFWKRNYTIVLGY